LKNWKVQAVVIGLLLLFSGVGIFYFLSPSGRARNVLRLEKQADQAVAAGQLLDAEILVRKALEVEPNAPDLLLKLGTVLEKEGVLSQAKDVYVQASAAKKSAGPGYYAGVVALKMNDRGEAERLFVENNLNWPEHVPTMYQLGAILAKKGQYKEALPFFQRVTELEPNEAEAYTNLGFCYYNLEQPEKAKEMYLKALELNSNFEPARKSLQAVEADLTGKPQQGLTSEKCPTCR